MEVGMTQHCGGGQCLRSIMGKAVDFDPGKQSVCLEDEDPGQIIALTDEIIAQDKGVGRHDRWAADCKVDAGAATGALQSCRFGAIELLDVSSSLG